MSEDFEAPKDDLDKELPAGSEEHSDYKPADAKDANIKHQLSGMYQNWFLDYASYVILERAVPHHGWSETRTAAYPPLHAPHGRRALQQGGEHRRTYHAVPSAR